MKKHIAIVIFILVYVLSFAQSPQAFKYQAIARDNSGEVLINQLVSLKISLLQDAIDGTAVYVETYNTTSNDFGLINLEIGNGIPESGDFSAIDWGNHSYFVKIEMDETGGIDYQFMGISKLLSVPYALYAGKTGVTTLAGHSATELDDITSTGSGVIITATERTNFTTAYNWGDHASAGYLNTETDPKIGSNTLNYLSKWNGSALVSSTIFDNGNIGIGTNNPGEALEVIGAIRIGTTNNLNAGAIRFNNDVFQGYNGTEWLQLSGGSGTPWITSGTDVYYNSGNVGINNTNPTTELDVNGVITATGGNSTNWNTAFGWGDHSIADYLTSYTETDPVFGVHAANGITSTNITNWTAAYGWGNHSTEGYLKTYTETDPVFTSHIVSGITSSDTINWNTAFGWDDHSTAGYMTSYSETDPIFSTHISSGINATDTANWNEAYGWGNHSATGYLTSETDPQFSSHLASGITEIDTTNWSTAYNWDDHSGLGYLTSENQNLTDVLSQGTDAGGNNITNLADPVNDQDVATKAYIDQMKAEIFTQIAGGKVIDYDGNSYNTVKIGNQIWMAENLKVTTYPDGTPILDIYPIFSYSGGYRWYEKDFDNDEDIDSQDSLYYVGNYGFLYSWVAIMHGYSSSNENPSGVQGVCPDGWHLPSDEEWIELERYLGMDSTQAYSTYYYRGTDEGTKLKLGGNTGFAALMGGFHYGVSADYYFGDFGTHGWYWTCTIWSGDEAVSYTHLTLPTIYSV